jgi:hypothetical protein
VLTYMLRLQLSECHLNNEATSRSCRNIFWKVFDGSVVQAIVSVIAVKIQFSSPRGVLRSLSLPGTLPATSGFTSTMEYGF